jgi:hypothetical protein
MAPTPTAGRPALRVRPLLASIAEVVLFVLGLSAIVSDNTATVWPLVLWNLVALSYLIVGGRYARREPALPPDQGSEERGYDDRAGGEPGHRAGTTVQRWFRAIFPILASVVGLVASLTILLTDELEELQAALVQTLGLTTMLLAWLILHVGYARRYQWTYVHSGGEGLEFPGTARPRLVDFLYFALALGTTFATSDVSVTSSKVRWIAMVHSVLGFLYNAIVLAMAFKLITAA